MRIKVSETFLQGGFDQETFKQKLGNYMKSSFSKSSYVKMTIWFRIEIWEEIEYVNSQPAHVQFVVMSAEI